MTAAAETAMCASDEIVLAIPAVAPARLWLLRLQPRRDSRKQQRILNSVKEVLVESIAMPEAQSASLTAVAEAAMHASDETSLATTACHFTAAEVASAPTAEQVAEVAAEPLSIAGIAVESIAPIAEELAQVALAPLTCEAVVVQLTPMLETQSVDMTAAAETAMRASDEIALAIPAVTPARLWLLRLQLRRNSRKQQRILNLVKEVLVESIAMPEGQSASLIAVAEAAMHASDETSLAATASHFTAAEVASAPTAEQVAEVAAEPLPFAGVAV